MSFVKPLVPRRADQSWGDWFVTNPATGERVMGQSPNLPMFIFIGCWIGARFITNAPVSTALSIASSAALLWWAGWELLAGDAPWRRLMGLVVSLYALFAIVSKVAVLVS